MADLTVREVPEAGLAALDAAFWEAAAADATIPSGAASGNAAGGWHESVLVLLARNTNAAARDITIGSQAAVTVAATTGNAVIPVKSTGLNHADIPVTYSATADLEVALVRVGRGY
jgi:hypothetical protein